jgi:hypothetical protein
MAIFLGADIDAVYTTLDEGKTPALGDVFFRQRQQGLQVRAV